MSTSFPRSLLYCPYILLSVQAFSRFFLTFLLKFSFVSHLSVSITFVLAACCRRGSTLFITCYPKLFSSALMHPSQLTKSLPPFSLCKYSLWMSLLVKSTIDCHQFTCFGIHCSYFCFTPFQNTSPLSQQRNSLRVHCHDLISSIQFRF